MNEAHIINLLEKEMANKPVKCSVMEEKRVSIEVDAKDLRQSISALLEADKPRFITLVAVDKGLETKLMYHFSVDSILITLRTAIPKETSQVETIADIVPAAELIEKEVSELFGLSFTGHPRTVNLLLPDDWPAEKKPLSKPMAGSLLPQARLEVENLLSSSCAQGILKSFIAKREKAGLPRLPSIAYANEDSLREFQDLIKETGFDKRAGYDWEKGKLRYK